MSPVTILFFMITALAASRALGCVIVIIRRGILSFKLHDSKGLFTCALLFPLFCRTRIIVAVRDPLHARHKQCPTDPLTVMGSIGLLSLCLPFYQTKWLFKLCHFVWDFWWTWTTRADVNRALVWWRCAFKKMRFGPVGSSKGLVPTATMCRSTGSVPHVLQKKPPCTSV